MNEIKKERESERKSFLKCNNLLLGLIDTGKSVNGVKCKNYRL